MLVFLPEAVVQAFTYRLNIQFLLKGFVARAGGEVIVVWLDIRRQVNFLAGFKLPGGVKHNCFTVMIGPLEVSGQTDQVDIFTALCCVSSGHFIFWEDGFEWAFWNARPTIYAGVWIDIEPGPFLDWFARDDAFDRAYINTPCVSQT
ncbi:MAG: hypothetical protein A2W33_09665 [Chloroflexi bacterium RBG_16_52_11]|nr:MAG: hypothetical protein A2W33_09665 [Chloroflexi bacterium RBG_16_52_11]